MGLKFPEFLWRCHFLFKTGSRGLLIGTCVLPMWAVHVGTNSKCCPFEATGPDKVWRAKLDRDNDQHCSQKFNSNLKEARRLRCSLLPTIKPSTQPPISKGKIHHGRFTITIIISPCFSISADRLCTPPAHQSTGFTTPNHYFDQWPRRQQGGLGCPSTWFHVRGVRSTHTRQPRRGGLLTSFTGF